MYLLHWVHVIFTVLTGGAASAPTATVEQRDCEESPTPSRATPTYIQHGLRENSSQTIFHKRAPSRRVVKLMLQSSKSNNKAKGRIRGVRRRRLQAESEGPMLRERRKALIKIRGGHKERGIKAVGDPDKWESRLITGAELRSDAEVSAFEAAQPPWEYISPN